MISKEFFLSYSAYRNLLNGKFKAQNFLFNSNYDNQLVNTLKFKLEAINRQSKGKENWERVGKFEREIKYTKYEDELTKKIDKSCKMSPNGAFNIDRDSPENMCFSIKILDTKHSGRKVYAFQST